MIGRSAAVPFAIFLLLVGSAGCGRAVDIKSSVQVADASTGWFDAGVIDGKNKLIPSITFRLKNTGTRPLDYVKLNLLFMVQPQNDEWDAMLIDGIGARSLAPGASTDPITVRGKYGYTGVQPRAQMLQNRSFQDFSIKIFAKKGSSQWTPLGEFKVARQLLTK